MKRITFKILGFPIAAIDVVDLEYVEEDEETASIGGGSAHNFTIATPYVDERYLPWDDEDKHKLGFGP